MLLPSVPSPQLDGAVLTEHQSPKVPPGWHRAFQGCVDGVVVAPVVPALLPWGRGRQRGWRRGGRAGTRDSLVNPQSAWGGVSGPSERREALRGTSCPATLVGKDSAARQVSDKAFSSGTWRKRWQKRGGSGWGSARGAGQREAAKLKWSQPDKPRTGSGEDRRALSVAQFICKASPMFSLSPLKPPFLA